MKIVTTHALLLLCGGIATAQDDVHWWVRASDAGARIVGGGPPHVVHGIGAPVATATGEFAVHFARDAAGKPDSLRLAVEEPADVRVAVERAPDAMPLPDGADRSNARVVAVAAAGAKGVFGVVVRAAGEDWYRFVWDREKAQLRLERGMGGQLLVLAALAAPPDDGAPHELALQAEGFRLRAWLDDGLVMQMLDGAHERGDCTTWSRDQGLVTWSRTAIEALAPPRAASAVVQTAAGATFVAATAQSAGAWSVLELALDRPHPLLLLDDLGNELWLLERSAGPRVLFGDPRGELGHGVVREIGVDAVAECSLAWPRGRWLSGQVAMARSLVIASDGSGVLARSPAVPLHL